MVGRLIRHAIWNKKRPLPRASDLVVLLILNTLCMSAKKLSLAFGVIFIAVGLLGYFNNPIIGLAENAIFHADGMHNIVHIVSGVLFLLVALAAPASSRRFLILFGIVYLLVGVIGFISMGTTGMGQVLGFLHVNGADNYLHVGLGLIILVCGLASRK